MNLLIPPLRDRSDDILILAQHFLDHWNGELRKKLIGFEAAVRRAFLVYSWPGNIRELDNVVYRSVALGDDDRYIRMEHLPDTLRNRGGISSPRASGQTLRSEVAFFEKGLIVAALEQHNWHVTRTAERLGLSRVALGQKLKKYGIKRPAKVS
jgi:transcriptional regulator with PAS, ATPase and Fis domain